MSDSYPKAEVDVLIKDLWAMAEDALSLAKRATTELTAEKASHEIRLEKVANASVRGLDPSAIDETLQELVDLAILNPAGQEKVASDLAQNPNYALKLALHCAKLSTPGHEEGRGVSKSASTMRAPASGIDPDGWSNVLRNGA